MEHTGHSRPNPDALLEGVRALEETERRGHLRVFFGMCPGVGKTFKMLEAAQERRQEGMDVVVGIVETHGREDTAALLMGLESVPMKAFSHRGSVLQEPDLDKILERRPKLVLIDELAHSNAPGSRHQKRYQDVEELLVAGIDVYTTLNVQHIESRSDLVTQITGAPVHEKVPDSFLELANQMELIDLPPEVLLRRLQEGKVYLGDRAARAADGFFKIENLTALRELALRFTAEMVDEELRRRRQMKRISGIWNTNERLLVAVSVSPYSARLIRATRRMAYNLEAPWVALYVETGEALSPEDDQQLRRNLDLARDLGADVVQIRGASVTAALRQVAFEKNVTQIVMGRPDKRFFRDLFTQGTLLDQLVRETSEIDIHVIRQERKPRFKGWAINAPSFRSGVFPYWATFCFFIFVSFGSFALLPWIEYRAVGFLFLGAVLAVGTMATFGPILFAAILSALIWNFFFIPPQFTFAIKEPEDVMNVIAFFIVAFASGFLTSRIKKQESDLADRAGRASMLYEFTKSLGAARTGREIAATTEEVFGRVFGFDVAVLLKDNEGELSDSPEGTPGVKIDPKDYAVAMWTLRNARRAGWGTGTLHSGKCLAMPLEGAAGLLGVLLIWPKKSRPLTLEQETLVETLVSNTAIAFERALFEQKSKETEVLASSEKLHQALLSSVSHELRTPLTAILGNATALAGMDTIEPGARKQATDDLIESASRLNRVVENLLDMTRITSGGLKVREEVFELGDFVGTTLSRFRDIVKLHPVELNSAGKDVFVRADAKLLEHVLVNLIGNSANYAPAGTPIRISWRERNGMGSILVEDDGPGIPPAEREKIFERFYRIPGSPTGGTGLGLSIARALIEAMGGRIEVSESAGRGAAFEFYIPTAVIPLENRDDA